MRPVLSVLGFGEWLGDLDLGDLCGGDAEIRLGEVFPVPGEPEAVRWGDEEGLGDLEADLEDRDLLRLLFFLLDDSELELRDLGRLPLSFFSRRCLSISTSRCLLNCALSTNSANKSVKSTTPRE